MSASLQRAVQRHHIEAAARGKADRDDSHLSDALQGSVLDLLYTKEGCNELQKREHALHASVVQLIGVLERGEGVNGFAIRNKTQFRSFFNERSLDDGAPPVGPRLRAARSSQSALTVNQHVNRSTSAYPRQATKPLLTTNAGSKCPHLMKAALLDCCFSAMQHDTAQ